MYFQKLDGITSEAASLFDCRKLHEKLFDENKTEKN